MVSSLLSFRWNLYKSFTLHLGQPYLRADPWLAEEEHLESDEDTAKLLETKDSTVLLQTAKVIVCEEKEIVQWPKQSDKTIRSRLLETVL